MDDTTPVLLLEEKLLHRERKATSMQRDRINNGVHPSGTNPKPSLKKKKVESGEKDFDILLSETTIYFCLLVCVFEDLNLGRGRGRGFVCVEREREIDQSTD